MSRLLISTAKVRTKQKQQNRTYDDIAPHLKIQDKQDRIVSFTPNEIQADFMKRRTKRDLVLKSRQVGMTTFCRADDFVISQIQASRQLVITDKSENTQKLRRMNDRFYDYLPEKYKIGRTSDNASTTVYANVSEVSIDTAGSSSAGRASTFRRLHASEVAFWKNANDVMSGILNTLPLDGYAVAESTPNGAIGWFYDECMAALSGDSVWTLHFYEWWKSSYNRLTVDMMRTYELPIDDLVYPYNDEEKELVAKHGLVESQIYWRRYKMKEDPVKFKQEHPEDVYQCFLASGNSYFGDTENSFNAPLDPEYDESHIYMAGLDFGQDNDFTVLKIIDRNTYQEVDSIRLNKMRWDDMRAQVRIKCQQWRVRMVLAEKNSMGSTNIESLIKEFAEHDCDTEIRAFVMSAKTKPPLIQGLHAALHEYGLQLQADKATQHEFRNFISKQSASGHWQYEADEGAHDDTVIATALALFAVMRGNVQIEAI